MSSAIAGTLAHQVALRIRRPSCRPGRLRIDGALSRPHHPDRCRARDRQSRRRELRHRVRDAGGAAAVGRHRDPQGRLRWSADCSPRRRCCNGSASRARSQILPRFPLLAGPSDTAWAITPAGRQAGTYRRRERARLVSSECPYPAAGGDGRPRRAAGDGELHPRRGRGRLAASACCRTISASRFPSMPCCPARQFVPAKVRCFLDALEVHAHGAARRWKTEPLARLDRISGAREPQGRSPDPASNIRYLLG